MPSAASNSSSSSTSAARSNQQQQAVLTSQQVCIDQMTLADVDVRTYLLQFYNFLLVKWFVEIVFVRKTPILNNLVF